MALGEEEMLGIWFWIEFNLSEVRQNYKDREEKCKKKLSIRNDCSIGMQIVLAHGWLSYTLLLTKYTHNL